MVKSATGSTSRKVNTLFELPGDDFAYTFSEIVTMNCSLSYFKWYALHKIFSCNLILNRNWAYTHIHECTYMRDIYIHTCNFSLIMITVEKIKIAVPVFFKEVKKCNVC